jgi:hypothetical protein
MAAVSPFDAIVFAETLADGTAPVLSGQLEFGAPRWYSSPMIRPQAAPNITAAEKTAVCAMMPVFLSCARFNKWVECRMQSTGHSGESRGQEGRSEAQAEIAKRRTVTVMGQACGLHGVIQDV